MDMTISSLGEARQIVEQYPGDVQVIIQYQDARTGQTLYELQARCYLRFSLLAHVLQPKLLMWRSQWLEPAVTDFQGD